MIAIFNNVGLICKTLSLILKFQISNSNLNVSSLGIFGSNTPDFLTNSPNIISENQYNEYKLFVLLDDYLFKSIK